MMNTDKEYCRVLADLLAEHGVEDVVMSPGSRNAPLIVSVMRHSTLVPKVVIDERSAGFVALGIACVSRRPVALICTSGTAVLNYAPAVAEAYYRSIPLIVISADRPLEWIDQDDSQTIRQSGVLANIVKQSVDIPVENGSATQAWMINRLINDALINAKAGTPGPVHLNVRLDAPLGNQMVCHDIPAPRYIECIGRPGALPTAEARSLAAPLAPPRRVLIIAGFMQPDKRVSRAIDRLSEIPNIAVMTEAQANIHARDIISNIDVTLSSMSPDVKNEMLPDVVITVGGSLVSRFVKAWLRGRTGIEHWHIGERAWSVDCFMCLTRRIELPPASILPQLASALQPYRQSDSTYKRSWLDIARRATERYREYVSTAGWCEMTVFEKLVSSLHPKVNLQVSNGTSVRYLQFTGYTHLHRIDCNRGVSGIDGSTSTAVGAAMAYPGTTVLITGDMSAQYDISALAIQGIPKSMWIYVISNGGGGIFRFVESTRHLEECEECFTVGSNLPLRQLADGYGFEYYEARDIDSLMKFLPNPFKPSRRPVIVNVIIPPEAGTPVLDRLFALPYIDNK